MTWSSWKNNLIDSEIPKESHHMEGMKCDSKMKECCYDDPDVKYRQKLKNCLFKNSCTDKSGKFGKTTHIPNAPNTNVNKNVIIKNIFTPLCSEHAKSHLVMTPVT